ncbi:hypothetical protein TrLO_g5871 [Triparma laevis f. longispina]|uniref:TLDc domain-containing protein n=1 Tax=Triparma laevis f. longispina TaxID=1714387 RepID=A0A9W7C7C6_9STRA|nr:hypothetical protein TrLO_g5871 [Triparma laevis f. longispina]
MLKCLLFAVGVVAPITTALLGPPAALPLPLALLQNTRLDPDTADLACVYKASRDGWSASTFHAMCDDAGPGLVICKTRTGHVGGFAPGGWRSSDDYYASNAAFLFYSNIFGKDMKKATVLEGGAAAVFDYATTGPQFGAGDLIIGQGKAAVMGGFAGPDMEDTSLTSGSLKEARCNIGTGYEGVKGFPRGDLRFLEVEVWMDSKMRAKTYENSFWSNLFGGSSSSRRDTVKSLLFFGTSVSGLTLAPKRASATKPRNEALCSTGLFTNFMPERCTDLGDITDDGFSKDLSDSESAGIDSLMSKFDLDTNSTFTESIN